MYIYIYFLFVCFQFSKLPAILLLINISFLQKCEDSISKYTSTTLTDEHVYEHIRYLTTIGEASEYCPGTVKASTECNLMNYLFPENLQFPGNQKLPNQKYISGNLIQTSLG